MSNFNFTNTVQLIAENMSVIEPACRAPSQCLISKPVQALILS